MKKFAGDIIILHMCTKNHNHMIHFCWYMECDRHNFLSLWTVFCSFCSFRGLWTQKNKILKKRKKIQDIIILQLFNINDSHMTYGFSDMECNRQMFLSFWTVFCSFTPTTQKTKFWKTEKKPRDIIILHQCTKNYDHMLHISLGMIHNRFTYYLSFWAIFHTFTSLTAQKIKI